MMICFRVFLLLSVIPALRVETSAAPAHPLRPQSATESEELQRLGSDRRTVLHLQALRQALQERNETAIRDELRRLESEDPLTMVPGGRGGEYVPLYRGVVQQLQELHQPLLRQLADEQDAAADAMLQSALAERQPDRLFSIILRYPCSRATLRIHQLLARQHLERGHLLAAAWWLTPVAHNSVSPALRDPARRVMDEIPGPGTAAADKPPSPDLSLVTPEGEAALAEHWRRPVSTTPELNRALRTMVDGAREARAVVWSAWEPIATDEQVLVRTLRGVSALDVRTGESRWTHTLPGSLIESLEIPTRLLDDELADPMMVFRQLDKSPMSDRLLRDAVTGRMSHDGLRLYVINTADQDGDNSSVSPGRLFRNSAPPTVRNELVALDLQTGRPLWFAGGAPMEDLFRTALAGAWICGVPAPAPAGLYCVAEAEEAIWLVCLEPASGQVLWQRFLVHPDSPVSLDPVRRLHAATPTIAGGIIFAQTTTGWVTAVDAVTHNLMWAARCTGGSAGGPGAAFLTRPILRTPPQSLTQSWRPERIQLAGTSLVICPHTDHQLVVLDALTGVVRMQRSGGTAVCLLHVDPQQDRIILGSTQGVEAWSLQTGRTAWQTSLPDVSTPAGTAVVSGTRLLVPTSHGRVVAIERATGAIADVAELPENQVACGGLIAVNDGLVRFSPLGLQALFEREPSTGSEFTLAAAEDRLAAGDAVGALQILERLTPSWSEQRRHRGLIFRASAALIDPGGTDVADQLDRLESLADTAVERATVHRLRVSHLLAAGRHVEAEQLLLQLLDLSPNVVDAEFARSPAESNFLLLPHDSHDNTNTPTLRMPVHAWAAATVHRVISTADEQQRSALLANVGDWTDKKLLAVGHPVLVTEILNRAERSLAAGHLDELTLQLVTQPLHILRAAADADQYSEVRERSQQLLTSIGNRYVNHRSPGGADPGRRLLDILQRELSVGIESAAGEGGESVPDNSESLTGSDDAFRDRLVAAWDHWGARTFRTVPVSQSTSPQRSDPLLAPADAADPLLQEMRWKIHQSPPMLVARPTLAATDTLWTVPGEFLRGRRPESGHDEIFRCGSLLLIASPESLTAVSVIDQRVLWSRLYRLSLKEVVQVLRTSPLSFTRVDDGARQQPLDQQRAYRICGVTRTSVCVQSDYGVEVIDLLTGSSRWKLAGIDEATPVFAAADCVVLESSDDGGVAAFSLLDGLPVTSALPKGSLQHVIRSAGEWLIVWKATDSAGRESLIEWTHALSGDIRHARELHDTIAFQFPDRRTLIAIHSDQTSTSIDLVTGVTQPVAPGRETDATTQRDNSDADRPSDRNTMPRQNRGPGLLNSRRGPLPIVLRDPLNDYVVMQAAEETLMPVSGRSLEAVAGDIRAVDRVTGDLKWVTTTQGTEFLVMDQPLLPMLVLVTWSDSFQQGNAARAIGPQSRNARMSFRGIAKSTGKTVFEHRVSSRWSWPSLTIDLTSSGTIDVKAFGSHVRFIPEATTDDE